MKSTTATSPVGVANTVSNTSDPSRYPRVARAPADTGAITQRPCEASPSNAAKHAGLSNRGQHNQSIDPARDTSAALRQSPISA